MEVPWRTTGRGAEGARVGVVREFEGGGVAIVEVEGVEVGDVGGC